MNQILRGSQVFRRPAVRLYVSLGVLALGVLVSRVALGSRAELLQGDRLVESGDPTMAAVHYRRAIRWTLPFNPFASRAVQELRSMGLRAKRRGDYALALHAFRSMRAGVLSARSFFTPHGAALEAAEREIAYLMAAQDPPPIDRGKPLEQVAREHEALLKVRSRPSLPFAWLALGGAAAWIFALFSLANRLEDDHGRFAWGAVRVYGLVFVVGVVAFFLGLRMA